MAESATQRTGSSPQEPIDYASVLEEFGKDWQVAHDGEIGAWVAIRRPTPSAQEFHAGRDLPHLVAKLRATE
ncbi:MAG TPA: hypothetical protein VMV92_39380 [Streptosporangiaceae bacterium]|nr:hypothetical protein [Streptosporangiaceae bacterium]